MAENDALRAQVATMQEKAALYDVLKNENDSLQQIVHLVDHVSGVTAPIVSSIYASPYGTFMIGAGTDDGVATGSIVLSGDADGFVIGRVASAGKDHSLVVQTFAPGVSVDVVVDGASIAAAGKGGNAIASAPRGLSIAEGDPVRAPAYGNMVVGVVGAVHSDAASAAQTVYIALPVALGSSTFVYVIPSSQS